MTASPDPVLQAAVRQHLLDRVAEHRDGSGSRRRAAARPWLRVALTASVIGATAVASFFAIQAGQRVRHGPLPAGGSSPSTTAAESPARFLGLVTSATGTLTGAASGTVQLTSRPDGTFRITVDASRVDSPAARHVELATSLRDVDCATANDTDQGRVIDFGAADVSKPTTLLRPAFDGNDFGDLSFMSVLVLSPNGSSSGDDYCTPSKMGVATLTWTRPSAYRALRAVDHGATGGARGDVEVVDGRPETYTVTSDDLLPDVAARFGLTSEQLLYLNPRRQRGPDRRLYVDEILNLDTDAR